MYIFGDLMKKLAFFNAQRINYDGVWVVSIRRPAILAEDNGIEGVRPGWILDLSRL